MSDTLRKNIDGPKSKYLVFSSVGDNSNLHHWLKGSRNFDLWICYYGDENNKYEALSDFYINRKGGKFPNLHYVYQHWQDIINHYDAIFVTDDDIIINGKSISGLFKTLERYDLWLLQPSFSSKGKISHSFTCVNPINFLRFTNFVEVTCPLFRRDKLDAFMKVYDPVLVGWGIDFWFMNVLGSKINGRVAIVDAISCINPHDLHKGGQREIELLQSTYTRIKNWNIIREKYNIKEREPIEYDIIKNSLTVPVAIHIIKNYLKRVLRARKKNTL
jgi:hypothetical protein